MATIRIRNTGRTLYEVDNTIAVLLCEGQPEIYQRINLSPAAPVSPTVTFRLVALTSGAPAIQRNQTGPGASTMWFDDWPFLAAENMPECPAEIIREYTRIYKPLAMEQPAHIWAAFNEHKKAMGLG